MVPPPPAPKPGMTKQNKTLLIIGIIVLVLCVCGVGAIAANLGKKDGPADTGSHSSTTSSTPAEAKTSGKPVAEDIEMPDLVGKNAAVAQDELKRLGFTNIQLGSADEHDTLVLLAANWTVVEQSADAGEKLPADALIVLTCSKKK